MAISLSERAASELKEIMASGNQEGAALRVWVAGGGCSGLNYGIALDENNPDEQDRVFDAHGVRIFVDDLSLSYMDGATVDFVDDEQGGGFKVENPNAVSSCGCGSSFATEEGQAAAGGCGSCGCRS